MRGFEGVRDLDLVREILEEMEQLGDYPLVQKTNDLSSKKLNHFRMMTDAGLLAVVGSDEGWRISWQGYDFLDAVRDDGLWTKTKSHIAATGGSFTFEIVKSVVDALIKKKLEDHTGLTL